MPYGRTSPQVTGPSHILPPDRCDIAWAAEPASRSQKPAERGPETAEHRILHRDWDRYDTRHVVYQPADMDAQTLESGYCRAYQAFHRWGSIWPETAPRTPSGARSGTWLTSADGRSSSPSGTLPSDQTGPPRTRLARSSPYRLRQPRPPAHPGARRRAVSNRQRAR